MMKENVSVTLLDPHNQSGFRIPATRMSHDTSFHLVDGVVWQNSVQATDKDTFGVHCQREFGMKVGAGPLGVLQL